MGRQRHSRTEPHGGVSNIAPCKRGRAARSLGYRPHPQQIAAEQQISQSQICYAVATPLKLTFYPTLHGATHRLHGATSETVLCTSWLRCSSHLRATGAMGRRQAAEPRGGSLINNPTLTRQRLCGESGIYNHTSFAETALSKSHLRSSTSIRHLYPHTPLNAPCGVSLQAKRFAITNQHAAPQRTPLWVIGAMGRRFITADSSIRRLKTAAPCINHENSLIY